MNFRYSVLTNKERDIILNYLFSEKNISIDFFLTPEELILAKRFNKSYICLGYALQYLFLKNRGISLVNMYDLTPQNIINYVSEQLGCYNGSLDKYWDIHATKFKHFKEICMILNYNKFEMNQSLNNIIYKITMVEGNKVTMVNSFITYLRKNRIILPSISTIETEICKGVANTDKAIYETIYNQIKNKERLDDLLIIEEKGVSAYSRIKNTSVNISSSGVKELLKLMREINSYCNFIDLSFITDNKINYFNTQIQQSSKVRIERFTDKNKKYSYLAMFLHFKKKEFMDMVIEVLSNHIHQIQKRSKKKAREHNAKKHLRYKSEREKIKDIVHNLLKIKDFKAFEKYQNTALIDLKKELENSLDELNEIDFLLKSYQSIDYLNEFLEIVDLDSNTKPQLVSFIKNLKKQKVRKNNELDVSCFNSKWQNNIKKYNYSKKIIDISVVHSIRDSLRSGDLFVRESKKYNSFDSYLIDADELVVKNKSVEFLTNLKQSINIPKRFEIDTNIEQDEKCDFSNRIYSYIPKISMPEIIYEVNQWTNFLDDFKGLNNSKLESKKILVASLLADGHNLGFAKMSIASSIDEFTLRRANEYYLNYENLSSAQKTLVNYHHSLNIVKNWGTGQSSSSDGMRVPINSKTIYADYNSHYGNKGGGIYRHVSDQYTPYYVQILEGRDSNHVLDGLLYHDTSLEIYDHSTDTAGYTEQMFALTYLLGFNFKPRIKNLTRQQLYAFENFEVKDIKVKKINENFILDNFFEIMRLVESIRYGKVKASLILQKINSYNRDNGVAKGLKEIGRILKTRYIIDYYTNKKLRKEVQQMLNKGESINSVARLIFFGKQGRLNESKLERQLEKVSCLNILLSVLIIWNSRYLEKVYTTVKNEAWFDEEQFKRVSPLGTAHVNFLGRYILENTNISTKDGLRDLEIKA